MEPVEQEEPNVVVQISAGGHHTVVLLSCGAVLAMGKGEDGQLGLGGTEEKVFPCLVSEVSGGDISAVVCGADHTVALSAEKKMVYAWGWGDFGRLGHGSSRDVFVPMSMESLLGREISLIACGDSHCLAVEANGALLSWGRNQNGQLGLGHTTDILRPRVVELMADVPVAVAACGAEHSVVASRSGAVYSWGWNKYGNLGLGDMTDRNVPHLVDALEGVDVRKVACGWRHSMALTDESRLYTFGWSFYGQLGHGDNVDRPRPMLLAYFKGRNIVQAAGGWRHSGVVLDDGSVYLWGWNKFGQLGLGHNEDRNTPVQVVLPGESVKSLTCGWRHTAVLTQRGHVYAWGRNNSGQLGIGTNDDSPSPVLVTSLLGDAISDKRLQAMAQGGVTMMATKGTADGDADEDSAVVPTWGAAVPFSEGSGLEVPVLPKRARHD
eukprot:jgi/Mesvir1/16169/Mv08436-RA.1